MKKIYLIIFLLSTFFSVIEAEEGYAFKEIYEVEIEIESTERDQITKGMSRALEQLTVNLSGSSDIHEHKAIRQAINNPEGYISEYRLSSKNEKIMSIFSFRGELIRKLLSDNSLPLWIGIKPKVLLLLPCKYQASSLSGDHESLQSLDKICIQTKKDIVRIANSRNIIFIEPSLDLIDLRYIDLFQPRSDKDFLNKLSERYGLKNWAICYLKDEFGVLINEPECLSQISFLERKPLKITVDILANELAKDFQLNVDSNLRNQVLLLISGIEQYSDLVFINDIIESNALVISYNLKSVLGDSVLFQLDIKGKLSDLEKLMDVNPLLVNQKKSEDALKLEYFFEGST